MVPKKTGWYWFLPNEKCPTPSGLLRLDRPVVVLVGEDKNPFGGKSRLVVRFAVGMMYVDDMKGDWEQLREPKRMTQEVNKRILAARRARSEVAELLVKGE